MNKKEKKSKVARVVKCISLPLCIGLGITIGILTGKFALCLAIGVAVGLGLTSGIKKSKN